MSYPDLTLFNTEKWEIWAAEGRQRGRVVRAPDLKSGGHGFKSRSDHLAGVVFGGPWFNSSVMLVNSQLVCLPPVGILSLLCSFEIFVSFSLSGMAVN